MFAKCNTYWTIFFITGVLGLGEVLANVWAAAVAVLMLHILLGVFVYKAIATSAPTPKKLD